MIRERELKKRRNVLSVLARRWCHSWAIVTVLAFGIFDACSAFASCAAPSPDPQCQAEFELFSSITWTGSEFVAVGHLNGAPASAWTIAVVGQDGRVLTLKELSCPSSTVRFAK